MDQEIRTVLGGQLSHGHRMGKQLGLENPPPTQGGFFAYMSVALLLPCLSLYGNSSSRPFCAACTCWSVVISLIKVGVRSQWRLHIPPIKEVEDNTLRKVSDNIKHGNLYNLPKFAIFYPCFSIVTNKINFKQKFQVEMYFKAIKVEAY